MTTAQFQVVDFAADDPSTIKNKLANDTLVLARTGAAYQCYANSPPTMAVKVAAGSLFVGGAPVENGIQSSSTITAPSANPRIDRVVVDAATGVASVVTGAEAGSPVAPAIPAGKLPCARIALATSTTSIGNSLITDERAFSVSDLWPRVVTKSVAGSANVTLTQAEQRCGVLILTGALTGNISVIVDATPWNTVVANSTSGNFTLTYKVSGQTGVELYQGRSTAVVCNGTDIVKAGEDVPPGVMLDYAGTAVVSGYALACDGSNVSRATYSALFKKIGTTWGAGDGSTTFGVPDSRRRVSVGSGGSGTATLGNAVGNTGGEETHAQTSSEMATHLHALNGAQTVGSGNDHVSKTVNSDGLGGATTENAGSGSGANVMQPGYVVTKMIRI